MKYMLLGGIIVYGLFSGLDAQKISSKKNYTKRSGYKLRRSAPFYNRQEMSLREIQVRRNYEHTSVEKATSNKQYSIIGFIYIWMYQEKYNN